MACGVGAGLSLGEGRFSGASEAEVGWHMGVAAFHSATLWTSWDQLGPETCKACGDEQADITEQAVHPEAWA